MPKVSVIIPNYNHAPYLKQRINSILAQTYQDFELIILDDQSTDNSLSIINQFMGHPKVSHIIFNEKNSGGPFHQWKKGIDLAIGEYIWIAESDDWCEPTFLQVLVQAMDATDSCILAYVQTHTINDAGVIEKTSAHHQLEEYINGYDYIKTYLADHCAIWNASMLIFRKDSFKKIPQKFTTFKMSGDWLFYVEMAKQGDVFISGRVLNYFRNHDNDVSGKMYNSGNNYPEELDILKIMLGDGLIDLTEYKNHLLQKYIRYCVYKYRFAADVKAKIEDSFYNNDGVTYKSYLEFNAKLRLLSMRLNRRLNMLFK